MRGNWREAGENEGRRIVSLRPAWAKLVRPYLKNKKYKQKG
jgi:hypothetical protein